MRINSDLILKQVLTGNEENYAPSVKAVKTKTDSIDSSIATINDTLPKRMVRVYRGTISSIAKNGGTVTLTASSLNANGGFYLFCIACSNTAWRGVALLSGRQNNGFEAVNSIHASYFTFSKNSSNQLVITNNHESYQATSPNVQVFYLAG